MHLVRISTLASKPSVVSEAAGRDVGATMKYGEYIYIDLRPKMGEANTTCNKLKEAVKRAGVSPSDLK